MNDRAFTNPPDEVIAGWLQLYGTTGVKVYELESGQNAGAVAWYREMSVSERMLLARLEQIGEKAPGAYDIQRMIVATALLYPSLDDYPFPPLAVLELFSRVRQHGHGLLTEDETEIGSNDDGFLPEHIVQDIRHARETAQLIVTDKHYQSIYFNIATRLASRGGSVDPQLLDWLIHLSPGRLRDIAAVIELAHGTVLESALRTLANNKQIKDKSVEEARLRAVFYSPFDVIDELTQRQSQPFSDEPLEVEEQSPSEGYDMLDDELLPDTPVLSRDTLRQAIEG